MSDKLISDLAKGTWSGVTAYTVGDIVDSAGSSYVCIANTTNNVPPNASYWALIASKGAKGDTGSTGSQGTQGIQGVAGVDGADAYVYVAYASDDTGTGFTLTFDGGLDYIAVLHTTTAIASPLVSDFAGLWKKYKGETGAAGEGSGDVLAPATNSADYLPQWNGANSKTLKNGVAIPAGGLAGLTALGGKLDTSAKATGADADTASDDTKYLTSKAAKDSHNIPSVVPGTAGNVLMSDGVDWTSSASSAGSNSFIINEVPTGLVNSSNTVYDTANSYVAGSIQVYRDGQLMKAGGADYTETDANTITFVTAPVTGSVLLVTYQQSVTTTGNADTLDGVHLSTITDTALTGWYSITDSWAYASADAPTFTITVPSGAASKYTVGMRVKLTQTTPKYFIITAIADTVLTVYGGTDYTLANAAISAILVSNTKSPLGFPLDPIKWAITYAATGDYAQATPTAGTWYNINTAKVALHIGSWNVIYSCRGIYAHSGACDLFSTLSTGNSSETNAAFTLSMNGSQASQGVLMSRQGTITVAAKTDYFLNAKTTYSGVANIYHTQIYIRAVSAYL